jgi:hypothetical protein
MTNDRSASPVPQNVGLGPSQAVLENTVAEFARIPAL